jgi:hypothetical protein
VSATRLSERGFHAKDDAARERLETVGRTFLIGFAEAAEAATPSAAEGALEQIDPEFRGFAYEGATMAFMIMDGLLLGGGRSVSRFLAGRAERHVYMAHIGMGWAMARLPRWRWSAVPATDPVLRWLVLDGYGFHQAYFRTPRYVYDQYQDPSFTWPSRSWAGYANRVIDQGIGRALWFVEGTDGTRVAARIAGFPAARQGDLYSGAGLAATYAGGAGEQELREFWRAAGMHQPVVAQASAFAAKARIRAGITTSHTALATAVFCGTSPEDAAQVTDDALAGLPTGGPDPAFEIWRRRIAAEFVRRGVCPAAMAGPAEQGRRHSEDLGSPTLD